MKRDRRPVQILSSGRLARPKPVHLAARIATDGTGRVSALCSPKPRAISLTRAGAAAGGGGDVCAVPASPEGAGLMRCICTHPTARICLLDRFPDSDPGEECCCRCHATTTWDLPDHEIDAWRARRAQNAAERAGSPEVLALLKAVGEYRRQGG